MKKFIAIIAAIALIATMSVSVFAADVTLTDVDPAVPSAEKTVKAVYAGTEDKGTQEIHLEVTWTDVEFKYSVSALEWDESQTKWIDNDDEAEWSDVAAQVDVATKSSCAVKVTAEYDEINVPATFDVEEATLVAADAAEGTKAATFKLTCSATDPITETVDAGTITITVAAA